MDTITALAEPNRRAIVELLAQRGELAATEIGSHFQVSGAAVSQHLKVLREAGVVLVEKRGQQRIYRINPEALNQLEVWVKQLTERWEERFTALDKLLAKENRKKKG